jgi:subtilisin family serine protease
MWGFEYSIYPTQRSDGQVKVWVFFRDKGSVDEIQQEAVKVRLSDRVRVRRQRARITQDITWYDLPVRDNYIQDVLNQGAELVHISRWLNAISVWVDPDRIPALKRLSSVDRITPLATFRRPLPSNEPVLPARQRSMSSTSLDYGYAQAQIEQINCQLAHDAGYYGQGVRVLLLDTGFNLTHEVFDSLNIVAQWDFVDGDSVTANDSYQDSLFGQDSHGTMVFSTLGGYKPGQLIGPAFGAEFLLAKTEVVHDEIQIEEDNYVAALEWGEQNGADVASSSLGYLDWYSYCDLDGNTAVTTRAVDIAVSLGMVCVTAAGNQGWQAPPTNPCDTLTYYIIAPADADSVIAVGAVNEADEIADFSSHGPTYDGRIKPEVCARGVATWCANPGGYGYRTASGTSLATPLVGGSVAVILSAHPDWSPMMVREALMMTAHRADIPDNDYGYGIIDVWAAINYVSSVETDPEGQVPRTFVLHEGYPNPFNGTITFQVELSRSYYLQGTILDLQGREVTTLVNLGLPAGAHTIRWEATGHPSGIYFFRLKVANELRIQKITYLK